MLDVVFVVRLFNNEEAHFIVFLDFVVKLADDEAGV